MELNALQIRLVLIAAAATMSLPNAADAGQMEMLGAKFAQSDLQQVSDRTMSGYFGSLVSVSEYHADDCGATMRITNGSLRVTNVIVALRRVADCSGPKPLLALRLTITQPGAGAVRATMKMMLGRPCLDGAGAGGAPSLFWSDRTRVLGVIEDVPPSTNFSVFYINQQTSDSPDSAAEQALRRLLEADLPDICK